MNIIWKLDLSDEDSCRSNIEAVSMRIIADYRRIRQSHPTRIQIEDSGIGREVADRLYHAGLPINIKFNREIPPNK